MSHEHLRTSYHVARKDYNCDAFAALDYDLSSFKEQMTEDDLTILENAKKEHYQIKKGTKYLYYVGLFDGDFCTAKSRIDLNQLCIKYGAYAE